MSPKQEEEEEEEEEGELEGSLGLDSHNLMMLVHKLF